MKLIRAILRHSLLLAIVVAAGLAYYYRDDLLPKFYEKVADLRSLSQEYLPGAKTGNASSDEQTPAVADAPVTDEDVTADTVPAPQVAVETPLPEPGETDRELPVEEPESPAESVSPVVPQASAPVPAPQPDLSRYRPLVEDTETGPEPVASADEGEAASATPAEPDSSAVVAEEKVASDQQKAAATEQVSTAPAEPRVVPETAGAAPPATADPQENERLRVSARSAFWLHDYPKAESEYRALAALEPSSPDAYGELGNVYFSQGKWDLAAESFYEAAVRLIRMGEEQRARDLLVIIRGLNPEKSKELEGQLSQARDRAGN